MASTSKLPKPSAAKFNSNKPVAARKLNLAEKKDTGSVRSSSRTMRKRSPQRAKVIPPKSPFKFKTTVNTPKYNFQERASTKPFIFGVKEEDAPTPRPSRKTTFKNVVGNYNSRVDKYVAMSARERRMAYSKQVDGRNLVSNNTKKSQAAAPKRDVKQRTRDDRNNRRQRRENRIKNSAEERRAGHMKNRPL